MKKAINRWAMPATWSLEKVITAAATNGFDGIELNLEESGDFGLETTPEAAEANAASRVGTMSQFW